MKTQPFQSLEVKAAFKAFSPPILEGVMRLRDLVFEVAHETPEAGAIEEALRWGQPSYLTPETKSGTTIRLGASKAGGFAIFTHCQSRVIPAFREVVGDAFRYDGNRAVLFRDVDDIQVEPLAILIRHALTYHQQGK